MTIEVLQILSSMILGLLVGSLLAEALILVPYWRAMDPKEFLSLHSTLEHRLYRYFAPLTIAGTVLPVLAAAVPIVWGVTGHRLSLIPAILVLIMLIIYFLYFRGANESFKTGSVGVENLSAELKKWAQWHWLRVVLGLIAFCISLIVLS